MNNVSKKAVKSVDIFGDIRNYKSGIHEILKYIKPNWKEEIEIKEINNGFLNVIAFCNLKGFMEDTIVFKVRSRTSTLSTNEDEAVKALKTLNDLNLSPELICVFKDGSVHEFVKGKTFTWHDTGKPFIEKTKIGRAAMRELAKYHSKKAKKVAESYGMSFGEKIFMLVKIDRIIDTWPTEMDHARFNEIPSKEVLLKEAGRLKQMIKEMNLEVVLHHGDTSLTNTIYSEKEDRVVFLDYDFTGPGYAEFDIASFLFMNQFGLSGAGEIDEEWKFLMVKEYLSEKKILGDFEGEITEKHVERFNIRVTKCTLLVLFLKLLYGISMTTHPSETEKPVKVDLVDFSLKGARNYFQVRDKVMSLKEIPV